MKGEPRAPFDDPFSNSFFEDVSCYEKSKKRGLVFPDKETMSAYFELRMKKLCRKELETRERLLHEQTLYRTSKTERLRARESRMGSNAGTKQHGAHEPLTSSTPGARVHY